MKNQYSNIIPKILKSIQHPKKYQIEEQGGVLVMAKNIIKLGLLARLFQNLKLLLPLVKDYWKGAYRDVSAKSLIIFAAAILYIISPIDLIPDYIIGLDQIDDLAILSLSLYFLERDLLKYKEWKDRQR